MQVVVVEKSFGVGIAPIGRDHMLAEARAPARVVAGRGTPDRQTARGAAAECERADGQAARRHKRAHGQAAESHQADGEPADGYRAAREATQRDDTRCNVADGEDAARMPAQLAVREIGAERDVVEGKVGDLEIGAPAHASHTGPLHLLELLLQLGDAPLKLLTGLHAARLYHAHMLRQRGFTWIEMLMVIGVIALLALMAIPSMRDGVLRKQVAEGLALADIAKQGVQAAYSLTGEMPADNKAAGIPASDKIVGNMVKAVNVDQGAITVTFGNNASKALDGKRVTLRPAIVPDEHMVPIAWLCHAAREPQGMQANGRDETDVPPEWLPVICRPG